MGLSANPAIKDGESTLWQTTYKLSGHLQFAEYGYITFDAIFLKFISDAFR